MTPREYAQWIAFYNYEAIERRKKKTLAESKARSRRRRSR